jgi:hypothetical protein
LIVCWKHNWEGCPLEVVELSKVIADIAVMARNRERQNLTTEARRHGDKQGRI